jgi:hypothetical protein
MRRWDQKIGSKVSLIEYLNRRNRQKNAGGAVFSWLSRLGDGSVEAKFPMHYLRPEASGSRPPAGRWFLLIDQVSYEH